MSAMESSGPLTIAEVAALSGLSAHTLRYYERIGLLDPVARVHGGQRRYDTDDLAWLAFLQRLRATGMPIRDMQRFAELRCQGDIGLTVDELREVLIQVAPYAGFPVAINAMRRLQALEVEEAGK